MEPVLGLTTLPVHAGSTAADGAGCTVSSLKVRWMRKVPSVMAEDVFCWAEAMAGNSQHSNASRLRQ